MENFQLTVKLLSDTYQSNCFDNFICDAAEKIAEERTHDSMVGREEELKALLIESIQSGEVSSRSLRTNIERLIRLAAVTEAIDLD